MLNSLASIAFLSLALVQPTSPIESLKKSLPNQKFTVTKSEGAWRKQLSRNSFVVLRQSGTEKPYTGKYWDFHGKGIYVCAGCKLELFSSEAKFDSHTGWPSFFQELRPGRTLTRVDLSEGGERTEVLCSRCGGHLGHVFDDGPEPTHLRYCMNSPALEFVKKNP